MNEWRPIESAPKDGTVILLRNQCMDHPVRGRWGDHYDEWSTRPKLTWVSERTPDPDGLWHFPAGRLVVPEEWKPFEEASEQ